MQTQINSIINEERLHPYLWLGLAGYGVFVFLLAMFHISNGDEGIYLYQSMLFADGQWPGFDYFTINPFWLYGVFGGLFKLLAPQMETARLFAAVSSIAMPVMMAVIFSRYYGRGLAVFGFIVLAANVPWLMANIVANHYTVSNLALFAAFFLLVYKPSLTFLRALAIGISLGIMVGTRLPLALTIPVFAWWMWRGGVGSVDSVVGRAGNLKYIAALGIGGIAVSVPDLILFFQDPGQFMYMRMFVNEELMKVDAGGRQGLSFAGYFIYLRLQAYLDFFTQSRYWSGPQNLFFVIPLVIWPAVAALRRWRHGPHPSVPTLDETGKVALSIFAAVLIGYSIPIAIGAAHLGQVTPYIVVCLVSWLWSYRNAEASGGAGAAVTPYSRAMLTLALVALIPYCGVYLAHGSWQILFRNAGGMTQMGTNAQLGCWLEKNISSEQSIISFIGGPAVNARLTMPKGFEQAGHNGVWFRHPDATLDRLGIVTPSKLLDVVAAGDVSVVIDDNIRENFKRFDHQKFSKLLADDYIFKGALGGRAYPFKVYLHKLRWAGAAGTDDLPQETPPTANTSLLREKGIGSFIKAAIKDVSHSLVRLPADLVGALARATGASFRARCQSLLNG